MTAAILSASWIRFYQPLWLLGLPAAALPLAAWYLGRRRGRETRSLSVVLQVAAVAAVIVSLARPAVRLGEKAGLPYLILRDVSASARGQWGGELPWNDDLRREMADFAAAVGDRRAPPPENATNLAPALRLALGRSARIAGVVIWTDGQFTDADWPSPAASLARAGTEVIVVPMESPPADARIVELAAEREGRSVRIRVTVSATGAQRRRLTVRREDRRDPLLVRDLALPTGDSATIRLSDSLPPDRAGIYVARLDGGDAFGENDSASAVVLPARRRVALVGRDPAPLAASLASRLSVPVDSLDPSSAPAEPEGWMHYAGVVLVDATGALLTGERRGALGEFVRAGGGLTLIGAGPHASPSDRGDPLNEVAALRPNPYERRPLQLTVVLDASGSMGGPSRSLPSRSPRRKFDLAIEAVLSLKRHLTAGDRLSVVTFSDSPRAVYDSAGEAVDFSALHDALTNVRPGGPTRPAGALRFATAQSASQGRDALVLLVTDLATEPFDVSDMAVRFRKRDASLAVVATPSPQSTARPHSSVEELAGELGARVIRGGTLTALADIFAGLLRDARGDALRRGRFVASAPAAPFDVQLPRAPLDAYVLSAPSAGAEVLASVGGDPILARRRVGLGRSVSLAVPLTARQNAAWQRREETLDLLAAAVRWGLRPAEDTRFSVELERDEERVHVRLLGRDGDEPMNGMNLIALARPAGSQAVPRSAAFLQVGPGTYEADLPLSPHPSPTSVIVRDTSTGRTVWSGTTGTTYPPEFTATGAHRSNLRRLAELTDGRIVARSALRELTGELSSEGFAPVWTYLLTAALGVMLMEWALMRIRRRPIAGCERRVPRSQATPLR